ncbi:MAG TPA: ferredoxin [Actinobacteria bacterium]|nr:ferredoxin [Actinomycetota bacterium]
MKPIIDKELCIGDGICEDICPHVFKLGDEGLAYVVDTNPEADLWDKVEEAARECPTDAILLEAYGPEQEMAA